MSNKIVDGVELLRMIKDDEIERGTEIVDSYGNNYIFELDEYESLILKEYDTIEKTFEVPDYTMFTDKYNKFEIKEKDEEIDIENLEELNVETFTLPNGIQNQISLREQEERKIINELIKAVKQLDNRLQPIDTSIDNHIPRIY